MDIDVPLRMNLYELSCSVIMSLNCQICTHFKTMTRRNYCTFKPVLLTIFPSQPPVGLNCRLAQETCHENLKSQIALQKNHSLWFPSWETCIRRTTEKVCQAGWISAAAEQSRYKKIKTGDADAAEVYLCLWGNLGFSGAWLPVWAALGGRGLYLLSGRQVLDGFVTFQDAFFNHSFARCIASPPSAQKTPGSAKSAGCTLSTGN